MASVHTCVTEAKDVTSSFFLCSELGMIGTLAGYLQGQQVSKSKQKSAFLGGQPKSQQKSAFLDEGQQN